MRIFILIFFLLAFNYPVISQTYVAQFKSAESKLWGFVNIDGKEIIPAKYIKAFEFSEDGFAPTYSPNSDAYYMVDLDGMPLKTEHYFNIKRGYKDMYVWGFKDGFLPIEIRGKWGYLNVKGEIVVETIYDYASQYEKGYGLVRLKKTFGIVDVTGNVIELDSDVIEVKPFSEGLAPIRMKNKMYGFVNVYGEIVIEAKFKTVGYFSNGLAWARSKSGNIGYIDKNGGWLINPIFSSAKNFDKESELAKVKIGSTWKFVNKNGEILDVYKSQLSHEFHEGLCIVKENYLVGFINSKGETVIDLKFDAVRDFKNGYAAAKKSNKWGVINKKGEWVIEPKYAVVKDMELVNVSD
ncbi:MAG: WG repeat-containing protein [Cyclobacteriaceae bacterium]|nr:WG repeat-containing protein [Cyclobacteriaceae bacterium]